MKKGSQITFVVFFRKENLSRYIRNNGTENIKYRINVNSYHHTATFNHKSFLVNAIIARNIVLSSIERKHLRVFTVEQSICIIGVYIQSSYKCS